MNTRTNFNTLSLLGNVPIKFYFEDKTIEFIPPTIQLSELDPDFVLFKGLLDYDVKEFNQVSQQKFFVVENTYEVLLAFLKLEVNKDIILKYLNILFPNIEYKEDQLMVNSMPLLPEEYSILVDAVLISIAEKPLTDFMKNTLVKKLDPMQQKLQEHEEKIKQLNKKKNSKETKSSITIDQIVIALVYEFGFSIEQVYQMNMFTLLHFWSYISKVVDNQIMVTAVGNGLTKDFTYFIN